MLREKKNKKNRGGGGGGHGWLVAFAAWFGLY